MKSRAADCEDFSALRNTSGVDCVQTPKRNEFHQAAPNGDLGSTPMQVISRHHNSQCLPPVPPNHQFVAVVKLPDGNLYMATTGSNAPDAPVTESAASKSVETMRNLTAEMHNSMVVPSPATPVSPSPSAATFPETPKSEKQRWLPAKRLFPPDDSGEPAMSSPCKTPKIHSRDCKTKCNSVSTVVPSDILKDLVITRTLRRSSYADGNSLVEVKPASLPGSPTMFAYRTPTGCIRVPMDMQSNQNALATYHNMKEATSQCSSFFPADERYPMQPDLPSSTRKSSGDQYCPDPDEDSLNHSYSGTGLLTIFNDNHVTDSTRSIIDEWQKLQEIL